MSGDVGGSGYERSDINVRSIAIFAVALVAGCGLLMAATVWLYGAFGSHEMEGQRTLAPATRVPLAAPRHPPDPVIQGAPGSRFELEDPTVELVDHRARQEQRLTTAGWIDREAGIVHIPIEDAKQLLLQRGLPLRDDPPAPEAAP